MYRVMPLIMQTTLPNFSSLATLVPMLVSAFGFHILAIYQFTPMSDDIQLSFDLM